MYLTMKSKIKNIISKITLAIIVTVITLVVYVLISNVVAAKKNEPAKIFGYSYSYVPTNSMEPNIKTGSWVFFNQPKFETLKVNDVIIYRANDGVMKGQLIIHRIIEKTSDGFKLQGDNNPTPDKQIVTKQDYYGKHVKSIYIPILSQTFSTAMLNKNFVFALVGITLLILVIFNVLNIYIAFKKESLNNKDDLKEKMRLEMLEELKKEISQKED